MNTLDHQAQVRSFMAACGQSTPLYPKMPTEKVIKLRTNLINEEFKEFIEALPDNPGVDSTPETLAKIADSIADLLYVVYGSAVAFGIDINPVFDEVHRSNMTKLDGMVRQDGKILKGPSYDPPQVTSIINYQLTGADSFNMTLRGGISWEEVTA